MTTSATVKSVWNMNSECDKLIVESGGKAEQFTTPCKCSYNCKNVNCEILL